MKEIRERLESELSHIVNRIRRMGGAVVFEEFPGALGDNSSPFALERRRGGESGEPAKHLQPLGVARDADAADEE
jgi:hypothetical protein